MIASAPTALRSRCLRLGAAVALVLPLLLQGCGGGGGGSDGSTPQPQALGDFSITLTSVGIAQNPSFRATGSGTPTSYAWDFGDGTTLTTTTAEASHTYRDAGEYSVKLVVTDAAGRSVQASRRATVRLPELSVQIQPHDAWGGVATGNAVLRFSANLLMYRGVIAIPPQTRFDWTFSDGGTAQGAAVSHRFTQGGTQTVTLKVTDAGGATAEASTTVQITPALLPMATYTGGAAFVDGRGTAARIGWSNRMLVDPLRDRAWIWDWIAGPETLRRVDLRTGDVMTLPVGKGNSPRKDANYGLGYLPWTTAAAIDVSGGLVIASQEIDGAVYRVAPDGELRLVFANWSTVDGQGNRLYASAQAVAVTSAGDIYIADRHAVFLYQDQRLRLVAGELTTPGSDDGAALQARFGAIQGLAVMPDGAVMIADGCLRVRRLSPDGQVTTVTRAGDAPIDSRCVGDFQPAPGGGFLVSTWGQKFQHGDEQGRLTALATGGAYTTQNALGVDRAGRTVFIDRSGTQLKRIDADGAITVLAGKSAWKDATDSLPAGLPGDLREVQRWALHPDGNTLYFFDAGRLLQLAMSTGRVSSVHGSPAGQPALTVPVRTASAGIDDYADLAVDRQGNIYFADYPKLSRLGADGVISTVAGSASAVKDADGTGAAADLAGLFSVTVDRGGVVYGLVGTRVVRITPAGEVRTLPVRLPGSGFPLVNRLLVDASDRLLMVSSYGIYQYVENGDPVLLSGPGAPTPGSINTLMNETAILAPNGSVCRFNSFDNRLFCVRLDGSAANPLIGEDVTLAVDLPGASEALPILRHWSKALFDPSGRLIVAGREGFSVFRSQLPYIAP